MRQRAIGVDPRATLRDQTMRACQGHRFNEVPRSDLTKPSRGTQLLRRESGREIGQLMNDGLWLGGGDRVSDGVRVERIEDDGLGAGRMKPLGARNVAGRAENAMASAHQHRHELTADSACAARKEHAHLRRD